MPEPRTWQLTACSAVLGLALSAGAVTAAGPWDNGQRKAERARAAAATPTGGAHHAAPRPPAGPQRPAPAPSAAGVLRALDTPRTALGSDLAAVLVPLLADPGLGPLRTASVVDATTGKQLYGEGATTPMTPASTIKIATSVAALSALGADHRIPTTVVASPDARTVTLVGGGDPTLDRARLKSLAGSTARALKARGVTGGVRIAYDTRLYQGPARHPIGPNDNIAPVSALMLHAGRLDTSDSGPAPRSADPARDTAEAFAELLAKAGTKVQGTPTPGRAPKAANAPEAGNGSKAGNGSEAGNDPKAADDRKAADGSKAVQLARTESAPLSDLVERTLTHSDNDLAEALARQTALARKQPASFTGAGKAVRAELASLGLPTAGTRFADGSGLSRDNRLSAALLTGLLTRAADPTRPALRPVLTGLPVGGFSGTLEGRFDTGTATTGAGLVRAKTGTLTGVNTLAGTVVTADGRLLAFAFLAGRTPSPYTAQPALDRLSAALAPQG
ncbi:D-alanyl-D-alanine carboxypeptidase/D-alanyl-D-alanine-endopeptidase [Streptomyces sp. Je 1-79]|uniref:D-alanyl-D-alanine carboxypeptidase/D-alanyl-D-alanine endopeptidase n=1 Tax=Streptomyces sp. Je 1-79 TaxID=2943847 RepID=UPI0021A575BF|nr:D-alanyl-D-alanine carboxypeptidase/D-alanyl-D-alanine-endopeptidase [Streptomyces sp. Je 1-79]MCT4354546.1 D-alanyl-D-alanine carboxypeptidase/D-alanyl-D-alanine-endopeptidase [Streptomyces sp. Je 1-79]